MSVMSETPAAAATDGLRARNRERTVQSLEQAAWELVAEHGFEAVTADAVADRAGVSRRTFFNYFPRVELVLQEPMRQAIAGLVDRFIARPGDENISDSLAAILTEPLDAVVLEKAVTCFGQASTSSAARFFLMEAQAAEVDQIARAVMDRDPSMDALYARVVAGAVMSAGYAATTAWVDQSRGVVNDRTRQLHLHLLQQAFVHLFTAFSLPQPTDPDQES
ncbi:putative tetR-family transcriptional regulator [Janibacter sp. HTCC2649]|nr:putative tetR-family transcriptional regulator [Janibacter sp. HTCC2649]